MDEEERRLLESSAFIPSAGLHLPVMKLVDCLLGDTVPAQTRVASGQHCGSLVLQLCVCVCWLVSGRKQRMLCLVEEFRTSAGCSSVFLEPVGAHTVMHNHCSARPSQPKDWYCHLTSVQGKGS